MDLCARYRGVQQEYKVLDGSDRAILKYTLPLAGESTDFLALAQDMADHSRNRHGFLFGPQERELGIRLVRLRRSWIRVFGSGQGRLLNTIQRRTSGWTDA
jgi:hypothetical protein